MPSMRKHKNVGMLFHHQTFITVVHNDAYTCEQFSKLSVGPALDLALRVFSALAYAILFLRQV